YLPDYGYESVVVTGPGDSDDHWTPEDTSLLGEVEGVANVHRVRGPEPAADHRLRNALAWRLMLKTDWIRWWLDGVVRLGSQFMGEVDLIYGWLVPYDTAEAAATLSEKTGKPWVAALQDPWALDERWLYPSRIHRTRDLHRMRTLLGSAEAIVMNTPEAA